MRKHVGNLVKHISSIVCEGDVNRHLAGVEVGVWRGHTSADLLRMYPNLHLHMVDTWKEWPRGTSYGDDHTEMGAMTQAAWDIVFLEAISMVRATKGRFSIWCMESLQAAKSFANDSLDFAFLDANHTYEAVLADIKAWLPKVKRGGLISGHDYGSYRDRIGQWGVTKAVHEVFGGANIIKPTGTTRVWAFKVM